MAKSKTKRQYYIVSEIIIPFLLLFAFGAINLFFGLMIGAYAVIFLRNLTFFVATGIGIYLYIKGSRYVDALYVNIFRWRKPVFYILYYIIYYILYNVAYAYFMYYINNVSNTLITSELGAALAFTYKSYIIYYLLQIIAKFVRFIIIKISQLKKVKPLVDKLKKAKETLFTPNNN